MTSTKIESGRGSGGPRRDDGVDHSVGDQIAQLRKELEELRKASKTVEDRLERLIDDNEL